MTQGNEAMEKIKKAVNELDELNANMTAMIITAKELGLEAKRARALMIVIEKMVAIGQNHDDLPNEFYILFENAKMIHWAKDCESLTQAIKNI